jgi:DNA polymerase-1
MLVGFDTEYSFGRVQTNNDRLHGDITTMRPVCVCLYFEDGREQRITGRWQQLQELFDDQRYTFLVHGCHAEALFCAKVGLRFPQRFRDTHLMGLLVLHALTFHLPGGAYHFSSLAELTTRYGIPFLSAGDKDMIRDSIVHGRHVEDFGIERVLDYCLADARAAVQLYGPLHADMLQRCGPNAERNLVELYQPYALAMAAAARKGLRFDAAGWDRLQELAPRYRAQLHEVLHRYGYDHDGTGIGTRAFRRMVENIGLGQQWPRTPSGQFSTKTDDLKAFRHQHEAIATVYKLGNFDSFMGQDLGACVDHDGKLRCSILPLAQRSGRNSTITPNLMGIPGEMRPLLLPDEGCRFIHFDYSQQEPGVAAFLSGDAALLEDFAAKDVYIKLGQRLGLVRDGMSSEAIKSVRSKVLKSLMLAILYGKSARSIAHDVPCSYQEAVLHLHNFGQTYNRLFAWLQRYVMVSMERGWAENIIGYRAAYNVVDPKERNHVARSCQNFPIQSSAAACFQVTGVYLADFGADLRLPQHDAYLLNVPDDPHAIIEVKNQIEVATTEATQQLFRGLAVKKDIEVLRCFAKDGHEDSFENWVRMLEGEMCGVS